MEPRRTQAARSQVAREQITQAALTVFALKGYAASSMDDICLAAGCSKGGLYHHFHTKTAVLSGVVDRLAARGSLMPPFAAEPTLTPPALGRVLIEIWAEAARDAGLRAQLRSAYEALIDEHLSGDGGLARMLRIGTLIQLLTRGDEIDADAVARRLGIEKAA
jgi:AcrR family transcriptional regulator